MWSWNFCISAYLFRFRWCVREWLGVYFDWGSDAASLHYSNNSHKPFPHSNGTLWYNDTPDHTACQSVVVQCSYILFCVHFQTNSSLVWKKNQNFDDLFSKPIPVWFGKKLQFWRLVFQTNSSLVWKKWPHFGSKKFQTNNNMDKWIMVSSVCHWLFLFETLLMWLYSMSRLTGRCTMRARMSARGSARCCIERWSWCLWSTWRQYRLLGVIEMVTGRCARLAWGGCGGCWWVVTKE